MVLVVRSMRERDMYMDKKKSKALGVMITEALTSLKDRKLKYVLKENWGKELSRVMRKVKYMHGTERKVERLTSR